MGKKLKLKDCRDFAISKNGICLSKEYININTQMQWQCSNFHIFFATFNNVKNQINWCSICANRKKHTIEDCQKLAEERGGKCLSTKYNNAHSKLQWQCEKLHIFSCTYHSINTKDTWCTTCSGKKLLTIEDCQQFAEKKGGKCLTTKYINIHTKIYWKCSKNHVWSATFGHIKNSNSWCPECAQIKKHSIEKCQKLAEERGGECLSTEYINAHSNLLWICEFDHKWSSPLHSILNHNTWCPNCKFKSESYCRNIFEELLDTKFIKRKFKCMEYLELDGYSEDYELAFEYNGAQHEKYVEFFHRNEQGFLDQQERDKRKLELCEKNNIDLIIIPSIYDYTKPKKLKNFIYQELVKKSYIVDKIRVTPPERCFLANF
jgi:hypothetical protein